MACFALAAGITDLGPPSNAKPPIGALGPFRHAGPVLRQNGKPELLFIGTQLDNNSAAQRWPVVKALQQFGTLSNVKPSRSRECGRDPLGRIRCYDFYSATSSSPTFDWERAHYRSQYVAFIHKDLVDLDRKMRQSLSPQELKLFNRYGLLPGDTDWRKSVWDSILNAPFQAADPLPVMLVGGYVHTSGDLASPGDLEPRNSTTALPFATIQRSLQLGKPVGGAVPSLIADYNSEANIITALICHADHARPAQVCGRPVIRQMMKHIK